MERIISKDKFGNIACNNIIIYSSSFAYLARNIKDFTNHNWKVIKPRYYIYLDDNSILEIWYDKIGMLLSGRIRGYTGNSWTDENRKEITYEKAMSILDKKHNKDFGYNNKDLMSRVIINGITSGLDTESLFEKKEQLKAKDYITEDDKQNNNGGASDFTPDYYGARCKCGEKIDAYTVCDKYQKPHKGSAWHHAVKKLIRAGDGHKHLSKDIDEVIDSLKRWKEQINSQTIEKD